MAQHEYWGGIHAVEAAFAARADQILVVYIDTKARNARVEALRTQAAVLGLPIEMVAATRLTDWTGDTHHQGIVIKIRPPKVIADLGQALATLDPTQNPVILALEGLQDPHNLGACLRSAAGFGVSLVLIPAHRSVGVTPAVRKVACGGAEQVPVIVVPNFVRALQDCQKAGFWVVGTTLECDTDLAHGDWKRPIVLVMGAEETGLRTHTQAICDMLVRIPLHTQMQSLNVSVATGICLYAISLAGQERLR